MCFSPEASFLTAALTGVIGVAAIARVTRLRELPLAATPLIFGIQQAIEGALWLVLPRAPHGATAGGLTLAFLYFALVFWPIYAPTAALILEGDRRRRDIIRLCLAVGVGVAGYLAWRTLSGPRAAEIVNSCIVYRIRPGDQIVTAVAYLTATSVPLILSSRRVIFSLGVITTAGCLVAYAFYWEAFLSVWCFFAAAASAVIFSHFETARRRSLALIPT